MSEMSTHRDKLCTVHSSKLVWHKGSHEDYMHTQLRSAFHVVSSFCVLSGAENDYY